MSERLTELLRQRTLIQDHLAWLDREIAAEQGQPTPPRDAANPSIPSTLAKIAMPATATATKRLSAIDEAEAEKIIGQFQRDPNTLKTDARRGILTAFGIAFGLLTLVAFIAYWLYARHLGRWW